MYAGRAHGDAIGDAHGNAHGYAGRRGRRPLPCTVPRPYPRTTSAPPRPVRTHGRARRPRRAVPTGTPSGTPTDTRAAEDVGPYHVPYPDRTPAPRPHPRVLSAPMVGRDVLGAPRPRGRPRGRTRERGPPGMSAPTMYRATQRPCPAPRPHPRATSAPMVGRDVPGAPRPRGRQRGRPRGRGPRPRGRTRERHVYAGRAHGNAHGNAGRRGRRPLPCTAPCNAHAPRPVRTPWWGGDAAGLTAPTRPSGQAPRRGAHRGRTAAGRRPPERRGAPRRPRTASQRRPSSRAAARRAPRRRGGGCRS